MKEFVTKPLKGLEDLGDERYSLKRSNLYGQKEAWNKGLDGYTTQPHKNQTKQKMSEKAKGRLITDKQRKDISKKLSIPILCYKYPSMQFYKQYSSTREANKDLGLTGVLHVLKKRYNQCGGYFFEYKNNL